LALHTQDSSVTHILLVPPPTVVLLYPGRLVWPPTNSARQAAPSKEGDTPLFTRAA